MSWPARVKKAILQKKEGAHLLREEKLLPQMKKFEDSMPPATLRFSPTSPSRTTRSPFCSQCPHSTVLADTLQGWGLRSGRKSADLIKRAWSDFWQLELYCFRRDFFQDTPKKLQPVCVRLEVGYFSVEFPLFFCHFIWRFWKSPASTGIFCIFPQMAKGLCTMSLNYLFLMRDKSGSYGNPTVATSC